MSDDLSIEQRLADLEAENARLKAQISGGTAVIVGPGTPEHFYAVGGQGDVVVHPETGEPLINAQSGAPIIQEHPRREAEAMLASAQTKVEKSREILAAAEAELAAAQAAMDSVDARWDEIVADLVGKAVPQEIEPEQGE